MTAMQVLQHSFNLSFDLQGPDPVKRKNAERLIKNLPQDERRMLLNLIEELGVALDQRKPLDRAKKYDDLEQRLTGKKERVRSHHLLARISRARKNRIAMPWESSNRISSNTVMNRLWVSRNECYIHPYGDFEEIKKKVEVVPLTRDLLDVFFQNRLNVFQKDSLDNPTIIRDWMKQIKGRPDYTTEIRNLFKTYDKIIQLSFLGTFEQNKKKLSGMRLTLEALQAFLAVHRLCEGEKFFNEIKARKDCTPKMADFLDKQFERSLVEGTLDQKMTSLFAASLTEKSFAIFTRGAAKDLSALAIKNPAVWMLFSKQVKSHKDCPKKICRRMKKLDRWLIAKSEIVSYPLDIQKEIVSKSNLSLEKALAFLGGVHEKSDLSLFKRIDVRLFADWVNENPISLSDLGLNQAELNLVMPYLNTMVAGSPTYSYPGLDFFAHPESLLGLKRLALGGFQTFDKNKTLQIIKNLKLTSLVILENNPWGTDFSYLTSFQELESLRIETFVTLNDVKMMAAFPKLKKLSLQFVSQVQDAHLTELQSLRLSSLELKKIIVTGAIFSNKAFKPLLENLKSLSFNHCQMSDISLEDVSICTNLEKLSLVGTIIGSEALAILSRLPSLKSLNFTWCNGINPTGFRHLKWLKNLESLSLGHYFRIAAAFPYLLKLQQLKHLDLSGNAELTDLLVVQLAALKNLQSLSLASCRNVTNVGVNGLKSLMPHLLIE